MPETVPVEEYCQKPQLDQATEMLGQVTPQFGIQSAWSLTAVELPVFESQKGRPV